MIKKLLHIAFGLVAVISVQAQDMHFSQYYMTPLFANPAFTGNFDGTYRLNGVVRRQWASISSEPFQTFGGGVDMNAPFKLTGTGLGIHISQDQSGLSALSTFQANVSGAISFRFTSDKSWKIGLGASYGYESQNVNYSQLKFDQQFNGKFYDPNLPIGESTGINSYAWTHLSAGGYLSKKFSDRTNLTLGYSIYNLMEQDQGGTSFYSNYYRHTIQALTSFEVTDWLDLTPSAQFMMQGPSNQMVAGSGLKFYLKDSYTETQAILTGAHLRWGDAAIFNLGFQKNNLVLNASYDINYSGLRVASAYRGGWEVAVIYTIQTVRENIKRKRLCPDYF